MQYLNAFWVGGLICVVGQLLIDKTKLTPARILTGFVVAGVILGAITSAAAGISAAIVFGLIAAICTKSGDK